MVTFRVSDVAPESSRLPATSTAARLGELGWKTAEARRIAATELVDGPLVHPLALAVDLAFAQHRPLVLTPDAVWLCLAQSLATHIERHAEVLRPRLVRHAGQLELGLRRDDFVPGDPGNDWPAAVDGLVAQIRGHLGGRADLFIADFSTTTPLDRTASQIALMGAMRQYFRYSVSTRCGIPEVTLTGTPDDWASIRRRVAGFAEFDLAWWVEVLDPVLAQLEATARGQIDRAFWRRLYKLERMSGGDRSFGWINTLFAYVKDPPVPNAFPTIDGRGFEGHKLSDLPSGRTRVPFTWRRFDQRVAMELVGGLWGVTQDERGALGVATGWIVSRAREVSNFVRSPGHAGEPAQLYLRPGVVLETLASLRHDAGDEPVALSLWKNDSLRSLDGIQHLRGLIQLHVTRAPRLETVAPLAGMTSLRRLDLRDCPRLAGLGPVLETLRELESLCLMGNRHLPLEDFLPIARMPRLEFVVLWHCTALPAHLRCLHETPAAIAQLRAEIAALG